MLSHHSAVNPTIYISCLASIVSLTILLRGPFLTMIDMTS